jgi:hypothetical protein
MLQASFVKGETKDFDNHRRLAYADPDPHIAGLSPEVGYCFFSKEQPWLRSA